MLLKLRSVQPLIGSCCIDDATRQWPHKLGGFVCTNPATATQTKERRNKRNTFEDHIASLDLQYFQPSNIPGVHKTSLPSSPSRDARIVAVIVVVSNHRIHGVRLVHRHETILALHAEPATCSHGLLVSQERWLRLLIWLPNTTAWWTPKQQLLSSFHGCSFNQSYGIIGFDPFPCKS